MNTKNTCASARFVLCDGFFLRADLANAVLRLLSSIQIRFGRFLKDTQTQAQHLKHRLGKSTIKYKLFPLLQNMSRQTFTQILS